MARERLLICRTKRTPPGNTVAAVRAAFRAAAARSSSVKVLNLWPVYCCLSCVWPCLPARARGNVVKADGVSDQAHRLIRLQPVEAVVRRVASSGLQAQNTDCNPAVCLFIGNQDLEWRQLETIDVS